MANFILVHGAMHGAWCWERLIPLLQTRGHTVQAPDLLGMGDDRTPIKEVTMMRWAEQIARYIRAAPGKSVIVGHSRGGSVVSQAAELVPERLSGIIYLTAMLTSPGTPPEQAAKIAAEIAETSARVKAIVSKDGMSMMIDREAVVPLMYHRTDPAGQRRASAAICPEPLAPNMEPLQLSRENWGGLRRAYIEASDDRAISLRFQRIMNTATPCDPILSLDSDHSPFFSMPEALSEMLAAIAENWG